MTRKTRVRTAIAAVALLFGVTTGCEDHVKVDSSPTPTVTATKPAPSQKPIDPEQDMPPASSYLVIATCDDGHADVRKLNWFNGDTGNGVAAHRYFTLNPSKYASLSSCDDNNMPGNQERTAYNADFTELAAVRTKGNKTQAGTLTGVHSLGATSKFNNFSGNQPDAVPGSFTPAGNIVYKRFVGSYQYCIANAGGNRSCHSTPERRADDHQIYWPQNANSPDRPGFAGRVLAPGGRYGFQWNGNNVQYGSPAELGNFARHTAYTPDGATAPWPFLYVSRYRFLGIDEEGLYDVRIQGRKLKIHHFYKADRLSPADPVFSPDHQTLAFRGTDNQSSSLFMVNVETGKLIRTYNFNDQHEGHAVILDWVEKLPNSK